MRRIHNWHQTRAGFLVFGIVELVIAYGFASLAINRGSLIWYILTIIFLVGGLQNLVKLIWKAIHGNETTKA
jgi:hypothetical protein